jgi:hypothetical protein
MLTKRDPCADLLTNVTQGDHKRHRLHEKLWYQLADE